jgi:anti-anti-sigma factor
MTHEGVAACEQAAMACLGEEGSRLVVDLSGVTFMGSAALGMLVKLSMRLHDLGGGLALASPPPGVLRMLKMVGLGVALPSFPGVGAAAEHLAGERAARV